MTVAESMQKYLDDFLVELGRDEYVNIDWLDNSEVNFSISANPEMGDGTIRTDVLGNRLISYSVMYSVIFPYSQELSQSIANSQFFDELIDWIEQNNKDKVYPEMKEGLIPVKVAVQQTPYLFQVGQDNQMAQYTIILQLQYKKGR